MRDFQMEFRSVQEALDRLRLTVEIHEKKIVDDYKDATVSASSMDGHTKNLLNTPRPYPHTAVGSIDDYAQDSR